MLTKLLCNMTSATITSKMKLDTLLAELASAMQDPKGSYLLDLETLEVTETTNDNRYETDHVAIDETSWDMLPEWAQDAPPVSMMVNHQPDRFIPVPTITQKELLDLMHKFTKQLQNQDDRIKFEFSLSQSKPTLAFKKELTFHTGYRTKWLDFKQKYGLKQAKKWIKTLKITA